MKQFLINRFVRSWKSTLIGFLLLAVTLYLIYAGIVTYEAAAPLILSLWSFFRTDKTVKREIESKREKHREESREMSDSALRDDVQRMADK